MLETPLCDTRRKAVLQCAVTFSFSLYRGPHFTPHSHHLRSWSDGSKCPSISSALQNPIGGSSGHRLGPSERGQPQRAGQKGGEQTGPNPVDRGKRGSKYHLVVDRNGIPLAVRLSAANIHDSTQLLPLVDAIPPIIGPQGKPGRPRKRPAGNRLQRAAGVIPVGGRVERVAIDSDYCFS